MFPSRLENTTVKTSRLLAAITLPVLVGTAPAQVYQVNRAPDGPFAAKVLGVAFNKGSTLQRERVLLNLPSCPVQLTASTLSFGYEERGLRYKIHTTFQVQQPVVAVEIRHILYDVFGEHMRSLSETEATDYPAGEQAVDGAWGVLRDNDISEQLSAVSFVAKVRLADGKVWSFQMEPLIVALRSLNLEQKIEEDRAKED